jgi:hypothetical protein
MLTRVGRESDMPLLRYAQCRDWFAKEKHIKFSESWFRRAVSHKQIPFMKIGKAVFFDPARLEAWLQEKAVEPAEHAS